MSDNANDSSRWIQRIARWRKEGLLRKAKRMTQPDAALFEPLEPRLLLSADISHTAMASGDMTLRVEDVSDVEMEQLVDSIDPTLELASEALANIDGSSGYGIRIDRNGFDVKPTIDDSVDSSAINRGVLFDAGSGRNSLFGSDRTSPSLTDTFSQRQCRDRSVPMTRKRTPYKTYTKEFKTEAVRLMQASDQSASEIATQLGIRRNQLYKWKEQLDVKGDQAFGGKGRPRKSEQSEQSEQSEVTTLRQENERLKEEVEILKKAAAYFAREVQ